MLDFETRLAGFLGYMVGRPHRQSTRIYQDRGRHSAKVQEEYEEGSTNLNTLDQIRYGRVLDFMNPCCRVHQNLIGTAQSKSSAVRNS